MTKYPLKQLAIMAALVGTQMAVPLHAAVNMISVEHRVWGYAGPEDPGGPGRYYFDETSPAPLSRNASSGIFGQYYYYASSSASDWSIQAYASNANAYEALAQAQNTYVFTPFSREISISLNGLIGVWWFENSAKMELKHVASNTLVSSYYSPSYSGINPFPVGQNDMVNYPFSWNTTLDLEPGDAYELVVYVAALRGEGGDGSASLNLSIVPEPGVSLLACIAALFTCGCRRRPGASR